jgi:hypothetical protein
MYLVHLLIVNIQLIESVQVRPKVILSNVYCDKIQDESGKDESWLLVVSSFLIIAVSRLKLLWDIIKLIWELSSHFHDIVMNY